MWLRAQVTCCALCTSAAGIAERLASEKQPTVRVRLWTIAPEAGKCIYGPEATSHNPRPITAFGQPKVLCFRP